MHVASRQRKGGAAAAQQLVVLRNKPPKWNEQLGAYCLNFHGRVTQPSVKNFQLAAEDSLDHVLLQFGKARKAACCIGWQTCRGVQAGTTASVSCMHA